MYAQENTQCIKVPYYLYFQASAVALRMYFPWIKGTNVLRTTHLNPHTEAL